MLFQTGFAVDKAQPATDPALLQGRKRKRGPGGNDEGTAAAGKDHQIQEAEVNLEKLMAKLKQAEKGTGANATSSKQRETGRNGAVAAWKKQLASTSTSSSAISPATSNEKPLSGKKQGKQPEKRGKATQEASVTSANGLPKAKKPKSTEPYVPDEAALAKREARKQKKLRKEGNAAPAAEVHVANEPEPTEEDVVASLPEASSSNTAMTDLQKSMQKKLGGARFRWINEQLVSQYLVLAAIWLTTHP
jgi:ribosomal RNA-processing protein 8